MTRRMQTAKKEDRPMPMYEVLFRVFVYTGMLARVTYLTVEHRHHWATVLQTILARLY